MRSKNEKKKDIKSLLIKIKYITKSSNLILLIVSRNVYSLDFMSKRKMSEKIGTKGSSEAVKHI